MKENENIKIKSAIIAVLFGSLLLFFLISVTFLVLTLLTGALFSIMAFSELKTFLLISIWPTTIALGYFGYKLPKEFKSEKENYQISIRYTFLVNITYWSSFLILNFILNDITKIEYLIAIIGFMLGLLIWPFTLSTIIMNITKKIINKAYNAP